MSPDSTLTKIASNLPWLVRYPFWRADELVRRFTEKVEVAHLIIVVANHFEPGYNEIENEKGGLGIVLDWDTQMRRLDAYCKFAEETGSRVRDHDGTPFRHTNFYPAEQYHAPLLRRLAALQADGFGEVEVHLHHGVERPDTAENLRRELVTFRDLLSEEHECLSRETEDGQARYAFVHGNWALGNSARGACCGVDSEVEILAETGCYADLTLPSAPHITQVPRINSIYKCGHPLNEKEPHRAGPDVKVGESFADPVMLTGPLVFDWDRRKFGLLPGLDNSALTAGYPLSPARLERLRDARISVVGRPDWVFIKLYCHGFFDEDQEAVIGEPIRRYLQQCLELAERTKRFKLHFASAREAYNMIAAAVEGKEGEPGLYRDHKLRQIMELNKLKPVENEPAVAIT